MSELIRVHDAMRSGTVRTYGDLIAVARPDNEWGNCCSCHDYGKPTYSLGTRANICKSCCERKANEVLGSIVRAERKARRYAKDIVIRGEQTNSDTVRFYARMAHVSLDFMHKAIKEQLT